MGMYVYGLQDINKLIFNVVFRELTIVLGTNYLCKVNKRTMRYNVKKCKHADYKDYSNGNDIMLLKVRTYFFYFYLTILCLYKMLFFFLVPLKSIIIMFLGFF